MSINKLDSKVKLYLIMLALFFLSIEAINQSRGLVQHGAGLSDTSEGVNIDFMSLFGGTGIDYGYSIAVDSLNNTYVSGFTQSANFPVTVNAYNTVKSSLARDVFLAKISPDGSTLLFATFIGGTNDIFLGGSIPHLTIDSLNNPIVGYSTISTDFSTTATAINHTSNGARDIIIAKLSSDGSDLLYGSYYGGSDRDMIKNLVVDGEDNIYFSGWTFSPDFPTTIGSYSGGADVFVAKISADGSNLEYSVYYGGSGHDLIPELVLDSKKNVWLAGVTSSTADLPLTSDTLNSTFNGGSGFIFENAEPDGGVLSGRDLFIAQLSTDGSLLYSSFLGGSGSEVVLGVGIDSNDNLVVGGATSSTDFPITSNAYSSEHSGTHGPIGEIFITKIAADGSDIIYSTFFGGSRNDILRDLTVDSKDNIILAGAVLDNSIGSSVFPLTTDAVDSSDSGSEGFFSVLAADGSDLVYSTYIGGSGSEEIWAVTVDQNDSIYLAGYSQSSKSTLPFESPVLEEASPISYGGNYYAFVVKFSPFQNDNSLETTTPTETSVSDNTSTSKSSDGFTFWMIGSLGLVYGVFHLKRKKK
jgi:hypothetical protein